MLILNSEDVRECLDMEGMMDIIEEAYKLYDSGDFLMPDRITVEQDPMTLLFMPSFVPQSFGTKILTLNPENSKRDRPVLDGIMLVNDGDTGEVVCLMDGKELTTLRTGAVGGVGIRYTVPDDITKAGVVGTGVQGFIQLVYAVQIRPIKEIYLYNRSKDKIPAFKEQLAEVLPDVTIEICDTAEDVVKNAELIITTTTTSEPLFKDDEALFKGKHFIGIGSYKPTMREYPPAFAKVVDKVYIDTKFAQEESGDLCQPLEEGNLLEDKISLISDAIVNEDYSMKDLETTWFKSVGMSLFDVMAAQFIYEQAKEKGIGTEVKID